MTFEIFVGDSLSSKSLLRESNKILNKKRAKFQKSNTVFCKPNGNYIISIFGKRIRISMVNSPESVKDIKEVEQYLSHILGNRTVLVSNSDEFKKTFSALKNINIIEV